MVKLQRRPFGEPDDVRQISHGHLETYDMGEIRIGRSVLQPGWRWSESIKPIAQTDPIPNDTVSVRRGLDDNLTKLIRDGLLYVQSTAVHGSFPVRHGAR